MDYRIKKRRYARKKRPVAQPPALEDLISSMELGEADIFEFTLELAANDRSLMCEEKLKNSRRYKPLTEKVVLFAGPTSFANFARINNMLN
jgi:hypothetical protein